MAYCAVHNATFPDVAPCCPYCSGEWDEDDEECICDLSGGDEERDNCPVHYPIDDGSEDDDEEMP